MVVHNNKPCNKVYLAGPFFNPQQLETMKTVESLAEACGLDYFSPRLKCFCPPNASAEQRRATFEANVRAINEADIILACIDDFDAGTMWEMGYAYRASKPVYAYSMVEGRGLNLMLAQSCVGFLNGAKQLSEFMPEGRRYVCPKAATTVHQGVII